VKSKDFNALPSAKVRFVEPTYALPLQKLPQGQEWLYEVKFDGYRSVFCPRTELVAQIEFTEWTPDGHLRHSKFVGLRED
jgi:ATP-dependent DNA ligase